MIKTMTEQEYRAHEGISASDLVEILACPAKWRFGEKRETAAMAKGTQAHACLLEPEKFSEQYYRIPDATDYVQKALETVAEIKAYLSVVGVKAPSAANKQELAMLAHDSCAVVLDIERTKTALQNLGAVGIFAKDYERITAMSRTIFAQQEYKAALEGASVEVSIVDLEHMGIKIKARLDIVTSSGELWDYKTTTDAGPSAFGSAAHKYSYWLKMAFYHDMFAAAYGKTPRRTVLLAQEKDPPFLCQAYKLTREQLQEGRGAYQQALGLYQRCMDSGNWPAYGGGILDLETPAWVKAAW